MCAFCFCTADFVWFPHSDRSEISTNRKSIQFCFGIHVQVFIWVLQRSEIGLFEKNRCSKQGLGNCEKLTITIHVSFGACGQADTDFGSNHERSDVRNPDGHILLIFRCVRIDGWLGRSWTIRTSDGALERPWGPLSASNNFFVIPPSDHGFQSPNRFGF